MEQKILSLKDDKIISEVELFEYPAELIGGRNLVKTVRSVSFLPTYHVTATKSIIDDATVPSGFFLRLDNYTKTGSSDGFYFPGDSSHYTESLRGKRVTISFYMRGDIPFLLLGKFEIGTEWTKVVTTRVWPNTGNLHIFSTNADQIGLKTMDLSSIKIEKGNKATDWTPAPEDLGLSYPDFITEFKPSISDRYILTEELIEYPVELIGGRNFYSNSTTIHRYRTIVANRNEGETINGFKITAIEPYTSNYVRLGRVINSNGWWTVSFDARSDDATHVRIDIADRYDALQGSSREISSEWRKVTCTVDVDNYSEATYHFVDIGVSPNGDHSIEVRNIKVEKGSKATPWTPAPEDLNLSYPDNIQNFGLSFSNNILTNEFIEQ